MECNRKYEYNESFLKVAINKHFKPFSTYLKSFIKFLMLTNLQFIMNGPNHHKEYQNFN